MAAAYAALVSLTNIIHTLQNHPKPPITLPNHQLQSLLQKVTFLQEFLELHSHEDAYPTDDLESLIRDAAHAAEDAIESYIVDQIGGSTSDGEARRNSFYQDLQKAIEDMDSTHKQATQIKEKMEDDEAQQHIVSSMLSAPPVPPSLGQKNIMVGVDNLLADLLDKLTGQGNNRNIIPIVGMGGSGKTTLARNAYICAPVVSRFDIRIWVTVSQKFEVREILQEILESKKAGISVGEMGIDVHKKLLGRRYLIVLDDMWSNDAWDKIRHYCPDDGRGSRIIITTRISSVAIQLSGSSVVNMKLLNEKESWNLFCEHVFREKDACPLDWEEIGKRIAKNCKGLPLSIVVVGGLLAKSKRTKQYWEYVARNLNSIVNLEDNERCLRILYMSYKQLPIHLKPCFLYLGNFPEDDVIQVSSLVRLLVAEGFLKPINRKSIEIVAKEYIQDLVDRNLILVHALGRAGNIKYCKIHDLLRDLCLREVQKEMFLYVVGEHNFDMNGARRVVFQRRASLSMEKYPSQGLGAMEEHPSQDLGGFLSARSLISNKSIAADLKLKLLRICNVGIYLPKEKDEILKFGEVYNLRYLSIDGMYSFAPKYIDIFHHSSNLLWNIQTLIIHGGRDFYLKAPIEIWNMSQLRHVMLGNADFQLPNPPDDKFVLQNLQTLEYVSKFKCKKKVVERIPNIKKLKIRYDDFNTLSNCCINPCIERENYYLNNLEHLHQLENLHSFGYYVSNKDLKRTLRFPCSLRKLYLDDFNLLWEDITTKIGPLPNLEKLKLIRIKGREWRPIEGQFLCLKCLEVVDCLELETWMADETHFPLLERLTFWDLSKLQEIPSSVGDIPTLKSIELHDCSQSAMDSTTKIEEEQKELGNSNLRVKKKIGEFSNLRVKRIGEFSNLRVNKRIGGFYNRKIPLDFLN